MPNHREVFGTADSSREELETPGRETSLTLPWYDVVKTLSSPARRLPLYPYLDDLAEA